MAHCAVDVRPGEVPPANKAGLSRVEGKPNLRRTQTGRAVKFDRAISKLKGKRMVNAILKDNRRKKGQKKSLKRVDSNVWDHGGDEGRERRKRARRKSAMKKNQRRAAKAAKKKKETQWKAARRKQEKKNAHGRHQTGSSGTSARRREEAESPKKGSAARRNNGGRGRDRAQAKDDSK